MRSLAIGVGLLALGGLSVGGPAAAAQSTDAPAKAAVEAPASAPPSLEARLGDLRTAARVEQALGRHDELRAFDYALRVDDGVLTLGGALPSWTLRQEALALAGSVAGVREVVDRLAAPDAPLEPLPDPGASPDTPPVDDATPAPDGAAVYHVVEQGDSLYEIGRRYGVTVEELRRLNGLRSNRLDIGDRIRVR